MTALKLLEDFALALLLAPYMGVAETIAAVAAVVVVATAGAANHWHNARYYSRSNS